jgi:hypothetical protein
MDEEKSVGIVAILEGALAGVVVAPNKRPSNWH